MRPTSLLSLTALSFILGALAGCGNKTDPHVVASQPISVNVQMDFGKIFVTDNDTFAYDNPVITIEPTGFTGEVYILRPGSIAPGASKTYSLSSFVKSDGSKLDPENAHALDVHVVCDTAKGKLAGFWSGTVRD